VTFHNIHQLSNSTHYYTVYTLSHDLYVWSVYTGYDHVILQSMPGTQTCSHEYDLYI